MPRRAPRLKTRGRAHSSAIVACDPIDIAVMSASALVTLGIPLLSLGVIALFLWAVWRAARDRFVLVLLAAVAWLGLWAGLSLSGVLARFDARTPPLAFMFVSVLGAGVALGASPLTAAVIRAVPPWALIALQGFRLPLELVMHRAAVEGVMPQVMSYSGRNFDIVTGASALLLALALRTGVAGSGLVFAWNIVGFSLLANVVGIALLSSPMLQAYGPDQVNRWVAYFPFVYLPAVLVLFALAGHIAVFRQLLLGLRPPSSR